MPTFPPRQPLSHYHTRPTPTEDLVIQDPLGLGIRFCGKGRRKSRGLKSRVEECGGSIWGQRGREFLWEVRELLAERIWVCGEPLWPGTVLVHGSAETNQNQVKNPKGGSSVVQAPKGGRGATRGSKRTSIFPNLTMHPRTPAGAHGPARHRIIRWEARTSSTTFSRAPRSSTGPKWSNVLKSLGRTKKWMFEYLFFSMHFQPNYKICALKGIL